MKTGVAGCGRMGLPMAQALVNAGIDTVGFDIRRGNDFCDVPMEFAPDIFARDLTTLFTVVRDELQTDALLFDTQKILDHAPALEYLVICSTLSPRYVKDMRDRVPAHIHLIDAPMSGAAIAAKEARLSFIIGGETQIIDELMLHFMRKSSGQTWFGSNFNDIEFSKDGYSEDNTIGILAKDVAAAFTTAPNGTSPELTDALIETIRRLEPL